MEKETDIEILESHRKVDIKNIAPDVDVRSRVRSIDRSKNLTSPVHYELLSKIKNRVSCAS